jgi:hypothetical protein
MVVVVAVLVDFESNCFECEMTLALEAAEVVAEAVVGLWLFRSTMTLRPHSLCLLLYSCFLRYSYCNLVVPAEYLKLQGEKIE